MFKAWLDFKEDITTESDTRWVQSFQAYTFTRTLHTQIKVHLLSWNPASSPSSFPSHGKSDLDKQNQHRHTFHPSFKSKRYKHPPLLLLLLQLHNYQSTPRNPYDFKASPLLSHLAKTRLFIFPLLLKLSSYISPESEIRFRNHWSQN